MTPGTTADVLIIGAGPTGTALAIDLARRGLTTRVLDKSPQAFDGSRAKGLQPRTLEVLHDLGVIYDILAEGSQYPRLAIHAGPLTLPWRMVPSRQPTAGIPYPNTWLIPQYRTDRALHDQLRRLGRDIEFGTELTGLTQDAGTVTATVTGSSGTSQITARYAVGADGGASTVRKLAGIGFTGTTDEGDKMVIADTVTTGLSRDRWHIWPGRHGRFTAACPLPGSDVFQWIIRLEPGDEPPGDPAQLTQLMRARTRRQDITLPGTCWSTIFRPNIRLAGSYRSGRVLLAGDAAHVHTPFGAQGLNTGIQDAYNLGWKLGQVLAGADPRLLDSYEAERRPVAARVLGLSTEKYSRLSRLSPASIRRGTDEQQLTLSYHDGPLATAASDRTARLRAGDRAPDAALRTAAGQPLRLFDCYRGPGFCALAYGPAAARALDLLDWPSAGAELKRLAVDATARRADCTLTDITGTLRRGYGLSEDTLLLIRPDGYIGHIATRDILASTRAAVHVMTAQPGTRECLTSSPS